MRFAWFIENVADGVGVGFVLCVHDQLLFFPLDSAIFFETVLNRDDRWSYVEGDPPVALLEKYLQVRAVHEETHLLKENDQRN